MWIRETNNPSFRTVTVPSQKEGAILSEWGVHQSGLTPSQFRVGCAGLRMDSLEATMRALEASKESQPTPVRIIIVEDQAELRELFALLINGAPGFECVATCGSAEEALVTIPQSRPDVVLMDIGLPKISGIECTRLLKQTMPELRVMMLTVYDDQETILESFRAGATGYVVKQSSVDRLLSAIREIHEGGAPMSPRVARQVVQFIRSSGDERDRGRDLARLTPRENEILTALAQGHRYKEIASLFGISVETVRGHLRKIYEKLEVHSRAEAVLKLRGRDVGPMLSSRST